MNCACFSFNLQSNQWKYDSFHFTDEKNQAKKSNLPQLIFKDKTERGTRVPLSLNGVLRCTRQHCLSLPQSWLTWPSPSLILYQIQLHTFHSYWNIIPQDSFIYSSFSFIFGRSNDLLLNSISIRLTKIFSAIQFTARPRS